MFNCPNHNKVSYKSTSYLKSVFTYNSTYIVLCLHVCISDINCELMERRTAAAFCLCLISRSQDTKQLILPLDRFGNTSFCPRSPDHHRIKIKVFEQVHLLINLSPSRPHFFHYTILNKIHLFNCLI